jgi:hypothetical protein
VLRRVDFRLIELSLRMEAPIAHPSSCALRLLGWTDAVLSHSEQPDRLLSQGGRPLLSLTPDGPDEGSKCTGERS